MEDEKPPLTITELVQLSNLGIAARHVTWSRVSMTSDAHVCIRYEHRDGHERHKSSMQKQLMVINLKRESCTHKTWPMSPDSAAVSPLNKTLKYGVEARMAVKSGDTMMVLKLEPSWEMVAKCQVEDLQYWCWLTPSIIALITENHVLHWDIDQGAIPERMFTRHQRLMFSEIISYKADPDMKWFALTGLSPQEESITGVTQLYSVDNYLTQCISAHCVTFVKYRFEGNKHPSTVLLVASRDTPNQAHGKVHVVELGPYIPGNLAPCSLYDHIKFVEDGEKYDFPVALQVSVMYGLVYVITKYGHFYLVDLETCSCLFTMQISDDIIFATSLNTITQGFLGVSRNGQILSIDLKTERLVQYVRDVMKKPTQAERLEQVLAQHCAISGQSLI